MIGHVNAWVNPLNQTVRALCGAYSVHSLVVTLSKELGKVTNPLCLCVWVWVCVVCVVGWVRVCLCVCVRVGVCCVFMTVHSVLYTCQIVQQTGQQHWAASLANTTSHYYQHHWQGPLI